MDATEFKPRAVTGLLVSQVGYDARLLKRALIRSTEAHFMDGAQFEAVDAYDGKAYFAGDAARWGEKWGSAWWTLDFTGLYRSGRYRLHVRKDGREALVGDPFKIGDSVVWDEAFHKVAFEQFEERARQARHGAGWKDCGTHGRECESHTYALIGLCDLLQYGFEFMTQEEQKRLAGIIAYGCDYLCLLMDRAESAERPAGAIAHENPMSGELIPGNVASAAMALGYAARLLFDMEKEKAAGYFRRASLAFGCFNQMQPYGDEWFSRINRGIEEDYAPDGFMTRDLLMNLWAGLQLYMYGRADVRPALFSLAERILGRQIGEEQAESGLWGHFWEFDDKRHSEKANTHHHVGHDTGAVLAWNVLPLMEFAGQFPQSETGAKARRAACDFARNFALPACRANPFLLLPTGVFGKEGLLDFCGPWHGMNVTYGYFASMAVRLGAFAGLPELYDAAVGNLQWICGLNAGITKESLAGCVVWRETAPEGVALPYSQIVGVGHRSVQGWAGIGGTIVNGFCTNPQFTLQVPPTRGNDGPWLYTDEDWIPHAGAFLSAVAVMRSHFNFVWNLI